MAVQFLNFFHNALLSSDSSGHAITCYITDNMP